MFQTCSLSRNLRYCITSKVAFRQIYLSRTSLDRVYCVTHAYNALVDTGQLQRDELQENVVERLGLLNDSLLQYENSTPAVQSTGFFSRFFSAPQKKEVPLGIYLYGSVGCGKTMLMDLLYENIDIVRKKRIHFNEFMIDVHKRIHKFKLTAQTTNQRNRTVTSNDPIPPVAAEISAEIMFLCFDEFQVTDVADAMIMKRLFTCLFDNGTVVMATSNRHPTDLYKNGLQRSNFLPFIPILEEHCEVVHLNSVIDYRSVDISMLPGVWFDSNDSQCEENLNQVFHILCENEKNAGHTLEAKSLDVFGREVVVERACGSVAYFTFDELCARAVGAVDYLEICQHFGTIIIENIPLLGGQRKTEIKRFIVLIDNLYDNRVRVICSAANPLQEIFDMNSLGPDDYDKHRMIMDDLGIKLGDADSTSSLFTFDEERFAMQRTVSRLTEMMSEQYWENSKTVE